MKAVSTKASHPVQSGERGTALLLVMIFSVGLMALAVTLIGISDQGIREESNRHAMKTLDGLLRAGISNSLNEINHYLNDNSYTDPDGKGFGTILGTAVNGTYQGTQVTSSDGRNLGSYRATIKDIGGTITLTVVAAWPSFSNPVRTRGAQVAIQSSGGTVPLIGGDRNPLSINGPADSWAPDTPKADSNSTVTFIDNTHTYNAINTENSAFHAEFVDNVITNPPSSDTHVTIEGADPNNPGGTLTYENDQGTVTDPTGNGLDTVSHDPAGLFSSATLEAIYDAITTEVATLAADGGTIIKGGSDKVESDTTWPNGVYVLNFGSGFKIENDVTLTGSGTLIINDGALGKIDSSNGLVWDGDIYVWGSGSQFKLDSNATMTLNGNLFVDAEGDGMDFKTDSNSTGVINGTLMVVSKTDDAEFKNDSGGSLTINGVAAILGQSLDIKFDSNSTTTINGSFITAVATDSTANPKIEQFKFDSDSVTTFNYDGPAFESAVVDLEATLGSIGAPTTVSSGGSGDYVVVSYWESTGSSLNAVQEADITAGEANSGVGYKYDF